MALEWFWSPKDDDYSDSYDTWSVPLDNFSFTVFLYKSPKNEKKKKKTNYSHKFNGFLIFFFYKTSFLYGGKILKKKSKYR